MYLNQVNHAIDLKNLGGGKRYMALSAWLTFCLANITAGFELMFEGKESQNWFSLLFIRGTI